MLLLGYSLGVDYHSFQQPNWRTGYKQIHKHLQALTIAYLASIPCVIGPAA